MALAPKAYIMNAQADPKKIKAIDLDGEFSFGQKKAKTFLMANRTGQRYGAILQNATEEDMIVQIGGVYANRLSENGNVVEDISGYKEGDYEVLGVNTNDGGSPATALFTTRPKDIKYPVTLFNYNTFLAPIQLTSIHMKSTSIAAETYGQQTSTNFTGRLESYFRQAYGGETVRDEILFELYQNPEYVQEGLMRIDLLKEQKNIIFGNESVVFITLAAQTQLNLDLEFGAQASAHQRLYRAVKRSFENLADWYVQSGK